MGCKSPELKLSHGGKQHCSCKASLFMVTSIAAGAACSSGGALWWALEVTQHVRLCVLSPLAIPQQTEWRAQFHIDAVTVLMCCSRDLQQVIISSFRCTDLSRWSLTLFMLCNLLQTSNLISETNNLSTVLKKGCHSCGALASTTTCAKNSIISPYLSYNPLLETQPDW